MSEDYISKLAQIVIDGDKDQAEATAQAALDAGVDPLLCINEGLTKGIMRVGDLFGEGVYFLPELIIGAETMQVALGVLEPALLADQSREILGVVILGTVEGDLHEIGKSLVGTMLTAHGFKVIDIGADKKAEEFIAAVREHNGTIVGASALLTTTMANQRTLVEALVESGLAGAVKVMVGGAPVTESWAEEIGADGYAEDAISAVEMAKALIGVSAE